MSDENRPTRYVTRNGKGVIIYRLPKRLDGSVHYGKDWTRRKVVGGKAHYFNLGPDRAIAARRADDLEAYLRMPGSTIEEARLKFDTKSANREERIEYASIGDMLALHREIEPLLDIKHRTARNYRGALVTLVRWGMAKRTKQAPGRHAGGKNESAPENKFSLDVLTAGFVDDFKAALVTLADGDIAGEQSKKRSANTILRNAKALFTDECMEHYRRRLALPDLTGFLGTKSFKRVDRAKRYTVPEAAVVMAVFRLLDSLPRASDERIMLLLALHAGCRRTEAANACVDWVNGGGLHIQAGADFATKNLRERIVPVHGWVLDELRQGGGLLLSGNQTYREKELPNAICKRLRATGLGRRQPLHELRKLFGSYLATSRNLFVAQKALGHDTPQVTSDTYTDRMDKRLFALWEKPFAEALKDRRMQGF